MRRDYNLTLNQNAGLFQGIELIGKMAEMGQKTYVDCKAGRSRSLRYAEVLLLAICTLYNILGLL